MFTIPMCKHFKSAVEIVAEDDKNKIVLVCSKKKDDGKPGSYNLPLGLKL